MVVYLSLNCFVHAIFPWYRLVTMLTVYLYLVCMILQVHPYMKRICSIEY